ncbi:hypothetical protein J22TS1_12380 [Siminovitchia terrae]|uniref:SMI1/KNR4 family protein n=1 Tax=Siminovitchia terrae TaxID=1914933 RepID=A0A429X757_SIMTE|nr:SMI1/KNR4 family protein [Siminovitchia terrae]RST59229.1 SMI1/KNR4 family protein [Siminovitchia terrae]GIN90187.1 hypothetical protein J22TS1_12380 [Siminovitchia terrae]
MFDYVFDTDIGIDFANLDDLTDEKLNQVEKKLGVKFPAAYVELMKKQNGGTLSYNEFHSNKVPDGEVDIDSIMGIDVEDGIGESNYLVEEWDIEKGFVLFAGDGHEWFAFDYREYKGDNPCVFYITDEGKPKKVAKDFESFLKNLKKPEFDDADEDDDGDFDRVYTKEEVEEYIEEGTSHFDISAGLEQFAKEKGHMEWFIKQSLKTIEIEEIDDISWTVGESVLIKLRVEPRENWPIDSLQKIVDHLMAVTEYEGVSDIVAQRLGKRIQRNILQ